MTTSVNHEVEQGGFIARPVESRSIIRAMGEAKIVIRSRGGQNASPALEAIEDLRWHLRIYPGRRKLLQNTLVMYIADKVRARASNGAASAAIGQVLFRAGVVPVEKREVA